MRRISEGEAFAVAFLFVGLPALIVIALMGWALCK